MHEKHYRSNRWRVAGARHARGVALAMLFGGVLGTVAAGCLFVPLFNLLLAGRALAAGQGVAGGEIARAGMHDYTVGLLILLAATSGLCVLYRVRSIRLGRQVRTLQSQSAHIQVLRDSLVMAAGSPTVEAAVSIIMKRLAASIAVPLLVVSVCDETCPETEHQLYWHVDDESLIPLRGGVEFAMRTEYMESLSEPLWIPDIAGYLSLFSSEKALTEVFRNGCFVPFSESNLRLVIGVFFWRNERQHPLSFAPQALIIQLEQACFAMSRVIGRVQIENALRRQRALYAGMFENVGFAKLLADPETGEIADANSAAAEFFGYTIEVLRGMTLWQLHASGELSAKGLYKRALRSSGYAFEMRAIGKGGIPRDVEVYAAPVEIDGVLRLFISLYDVSQRKRAEAALADSEQRLRRLVENAPIALALCDQQCRFLFVNPAYAKLFGYTREEMKDMSFKTLLRDVDLHEFMNFHNVFLQEGDGAVKEWLMVRHDGELRMMQISCFILTGLDGLPQVATFVQDITERQRLEDMMIQSEKMASVGGLAAGMAHEINNPLGGILQGCQNIGRRLDPALPANRKIAEELSVSLEDVLRYLEQRSILRFFEGIRESASRAALITANMLDFSRRGNSEHSLISLSELMDKAVALATTDYDLNKRYDFKQVRIVREYQKNMAPVSCVVMEIEQVALNLLKNAAQAMGEASPPIAQPTITIRTRDEGDMAVFEVEDNGPGMPKHVSRRVFEPFYTTKRAGSGTGLGLAVSYFIITNNHRGSVVLDTVPARGTRFVISLPRNS